MKISLDEFKDRYEELFERYHQEHGSWGSLHIILADGNLRESDITFCIKWAEDNEDWEGAILCFLLRYLSENDLKQYYKEWTY